MIRAGRMAGVAWAALALLAWSGWFVVTRLAVTHALRPPDVVALRMGGGALLLGPALLRGRLPRGAWWNGAVLSFCWGAPFVLLLSLGIQLTSASHAAAVTPGSMPVFVGLIGAVLLRERPRPSRLLGYAVIVSGALVLTLTDSGHALADPAAGNAALLLAAFGWAAYTVRLRFTGLSPVQAAAMVALFSAAAYLPYYLLAGVQRLTQASAGELVLEVLYQSVLVGAASILAFNKAVAALGAGIAAAVVSLVPLVTALLAAAVLGEQPSLPGGAAVLAISAGVYLVARNPTATARARHSDPTS